MSSFSFFVKFLVSFPSAFSHVFCPFALSFFIAFFYCTDITQVTMDTRFGCLQPNLPKDSEARLLIRAAHEVIEGIHNTELGASDLWRYFPTKYYRQLCEGEDTMAEIVARYLHKKLDEIRSQEMTKGDKQQNAISASVQATVATSTPNDTILGQFFKTNSDASFGDILGTVLDLMLAGIDTTAFSAGFVVYYLARNQDKQNKLRNEIRRIFPSRETPITPESLANMPFLKACVKEAMRLMPLSIGVGRVTTQETVVRGYAIPPGVMVITQNQVACRFEENFEKANEFIPERWIFSRGSGTGKKVDSASNDKKSSTKTISDIQEREGKAWRKPHPFLSLPFGFGPRSCPGRRISDMNTYVLLIQLLRNFQIEYHYEDIGVRTRLINIPDKAMQFRFNDIHY